MTNDSARISLASSTIGDTRGAIGSDVDAPGTFFAADVTQPGSCLSNLGSIIALPAVGVPSRLRSSARWPTH